MANNFQTAMRVKEIKFVEGLERTKQGLKNPAAAENGAYDTFSLDCVTGCCFFFFFF